MAMSRTASFLAVYWTRRVPDLVHHARCFRSQASATPRCLVPHRMLPAQQLAVRHCSAARASAYGGVSIDETPALPSSDFHELFLDVNGLRFYAVTAGQGAGKPLLLFAHGFPECWYSWRHQMDAFKSEYHVVAVNLRGYFPTAAPEGVENYRLDILADDLTALVQALGYETATLVGHDWGGVLAYAAVQRKPELFNRLVVMCAPAPSLFFKNMDLNQLRKSWYMFFFQLPWLPESELTARDCAALTTTLRDGGVGVLDKGCISDQDLEWYKRTFRAPGTARAAVNYYRAAIRQQLVSWITRTDMPATKIHIPLLVLWAEQDAALGQQLLKGMDSVADDLEVHVISKASHWLNQERPHEVQCLMKQFFEKHPLP